jgi:Rrf2 family transcriptional regulator, nitric oxide-sensitive transcriptional repressor
MQLTRFTDLGLRVLMYLTRQVGSDSVTNAEISQQFEVSHNHLIKVVHKLGKLGWVETQRGRHGGLRLAADPRELRLGDVLRALEGTAPLVDCIQQPCVLRHGCLLKLALDDGLEVFFAHMNTYTLDDVCKGRTATTLLSLHRSASAGRA